MYKTFIAKLRSPGLNQPAVVLNLILVAGLFYYFWLNPVELPFEANPCTSPKVQAFTLAVIGVILFQVILELLKGLLEFIEAKVGFITVKSGGIPALFKVLKLWDTPNRIQWGLLSVVVGLGWLLGLSPYALESRIDPADILEFVVDRQDGAAPTRIKNGGTISLPLEAVVIVNTDVPFNPAYTCLWTTQAARLNNSQECTVKYSPLTSTTDLLKVTLRSTCSPKISEGSLIIRITP